MPQDIFTVIIVSITVGFIASAITDCIKDIHRTEERILIRKESMMKRKIEAKEKRRAEKLQLQKESSQEGKDDGVIKKAIEIAKDIHSEETEVEDKLTAIQDIIELDRVPKNVRKEDLVEMLRWLIEEYI